MNTDELILPSLGVPVVWEWEWKELEETTHISETSFSPGEESLGEQELDEDSDATYCSTPEKEHTITFKCIGAVHDPHAQNILRRVSQQLDNNNVVPVNIFPEPSNPFDSKAMAFKCWIDEDWHRIGYVVREALDSLHDAVNRHLITNVNFAWAKYLVSWTKSGPGYFAGVNITKHGEWPAEVRACASTR